jgi:hypothetical protein
MEHYPNILKKNRAYHTGRRAFDAVNARALGFFVGWMTYPAVQLILGIMLR